METNKYLVPAAVILAGVFIGGAVIWNGMHPATVGTTPTPSGQQPTAADISKVKIDGEPYLGSATAPVTIAFWSDYQCPFCKAFEVGGVPQITTPAALPDIITNYVNSGKVRVVFKDFAFLGKDSITGAEYGRAVWKLYPSQYFDWRTAMYKAQDAEGDTGFGNAASIDALDKTIAGFDAAKIAADVVANKAAYDAQISADMTEAQSMGVSATPSFILGKQLIAGAYPYATFDTAIKALLK